MGCLVVGLLAVGFVALFRPWWLERLSSPTSRQAERTIDRVVHSEELILQLTPQLAKLATSVMNLNLPESTSLELFGPAVEIWDVLPPTEQSPRKRLPTIGAENVEWPRAEASQRIEKPELTLWRPLLDRVRYFEFARFYFVKAEFTDDSLNLWRAQVGFEGLARTREETWCWIKGRQFVTWRKADAAPPDGPPLPKVLNQGRWEIVAWQTEQLATYESAHKVYREVTPGIVADPAVRRRLRESPHDQAISEIVAAKEPTFPTKWFDNQAFDRHPGVSVVDLDHDGWDDLYLMDQWGKNLLLRNQGDGTFVETAGAHGLDIDSHCSSAIFADMDNDGDSDLFLGRTLERSQYLVNEAGTFVDRSEQLCGAPLPYLVSSLAAADFNLDGLLDVYISTYAANSVMMDLDEQFRRHAANHVDGSQAIETLLADFLPRDQAVELWRRTSQLGEHGFFTNRFGPPNILLANRGGRFEPVPDATVAIWRNTYQSTWGDFDDDGDPDLYAANDHSPNNLFRNNGDGTFTDVTADTKTADIGFGMGASWGDYDNDGKQDLYVSNMFSKAGQRITGQLQGIVGADVRKMAGGNSLFRNEAKCFEKVSGVDAPALQVEAAGWSWGGQFVDVDNDGYLDLFVTSGYYTAPAAIALPLDL